MGQRPPDAAKHMGLGYYLRLYDEREHDVLIGVTEHEWPTRLFEGESSGMHWLQTPATRLGNVPAVKHLYRARLIVGDELALISPQPYLEPRSLRET